MTQDGDRFEPRLGRSRRDTARAPTTLRTALMGRVARAGGNEVLFRKDIIETLQQREVRQVGSQLEAQIGKTFVDPIPGVRVDGVYRQTVDMASGRFALIEKSLEFTLVPWRPALERHIGRAVSGIPHGDGFDWTIGRGRGGPSL